MAYSLDFRKRAIELLEGGKTQEEVAEVLGITARTLSNWVQRNKEGNLAKTPRRSSPTKIDNDKLKQYIQKHPDKYLREIAKEFGSTLQAIFYACKRLKITLKKTSLLQGTRRG